MLSGETAIGRHPIAAITLMRDVAVAAENHLQVQLDSDTTTQNRAIPQVNENAIALICRELPITKIIVVTKSGYAAQMLAARQMRQPILAVSNDPITVRGLNLYPGVEGVHLDIEFQRDSTDHIIEAAGKLLALGKLAPHDMILIAAVGFPKSGNRMNLIQTHIVSDLMETMGWTA